MTVLTGRLKCVQCLWFISVEESGTWLHCDTFSRTGAGCFLHFLSLYLRILILSEYVRCYLRPSTILGSKAISDVSQWSWKSDPLRPGTRHTAGGELPEVRQCCAFWRSMCKHHEKDRFFQHLLSPDKGRSVIITLDLYWSNFNPALSLSLSFLLDSSPNAYGINFFISMNIFLIYTLLSIWTQPSL